MPTTELEHEVVVPPPPTKTEAVLVPPRNSGRFPTAVGDGGMRLYKYELTKAVGVEDKPIAEEEVVGTVPIPRNAVDTINQGYKLPWNRIIVEDTI